MVKRKRIQRVASRKSVDTSLVITIFNLKPFKTMKIEKCDKCDNDTFKILSQSVNGGYTAYRICAKCNDEIELIDTYSDL